MPLTTPPGSPAPASTSAPGAPSALRRVGLDTAYLLSAFPLAVVGFVLVVTGVALGVGLLVVWAGLGVLSATLLAARGLAHLERGRLRSLQLRPAPSPVYAVAPPDARVVRRVLTPLRDPQSWLDALWGLVGFVTGVVAFCVAVTWWAGAVGGVTYWFWQRWLPEDDEGLAQLLGLGDGRVAESLLNLVLGLALALSLPWVLRACAATHAGLAAALLCSRAELQQEVRRVEVSRSAARTAEADSMRRLERDIHDGPQQRLVRLTMDLGRARRQLDDDDPQRARETVDAALAQARETVDELRSLSRGIAPPLLVDRGLRVALEELLNRSSVPVEATLDVPAQLPPHVENAVYFVVSEALTNVAKHSAATAVQVTVAERDGVVRLSVTDDGIGGAHPGKGLGLAGLRQRLAGVDGTLTVTSPAGGPTEVCAEIPV